MARREQFRSLALYLAEGDTLRDAAERAGMSERTAHRVSKNPKFKQMVKQYRSRLWTALAGRLAAACQKAITTLVRVAADDSAPATARVSACGRVLDAALRFKDAEDVERRLADLERRVNTHAPVLQASA